MIEAALRNSESAGFAVEGAAQSPLWPFTLPLVRILSVTGHSWMSLGMQMWATPRCP